MQWERQGGGGRAMQTLRQDSHARLRAPSRLRAGARTPRIQLRCCRVRSHHLSAVRPLGSAGLGQRRWPHDQPAFPDRGVYVRLHAEVRGRGEGGGPVGPCLRPSGCPQRSVPSLASSGDQSRRDSVAHADLPVPFRVHMSAYAQLGRAPLAMPTCDQPCVPACAPQGVCSSASAVSTNVPATTPLLLTAFPPRSSSTSASTETPLASDHPLRRSREQGPVGPSSACLLAREACIWGWWSGMVGTVRSSRQPVPLAAPQGATRPLGRVYLLVFADRRSDIGASCLNDTRTLANMGLRAPFRVSADPRSDAGTARLTDTLLPPDMGLSARPGLDAAMRDLAGDRQSSTHMCLPAVCPLGAPFRMSASTRTLSVRVHPRHAFSSTSASGSPLARNACIEDGLSARKACIRDSLSAPNGCIQDSSPAREACIQDGLFSAPAGCLPSATFTPSPAGTTTTFVSLASTRQRAKCPEGVSRQPVALSAPQGATRPLGRVYLLVFADRRSDIGASCLNDTRTLANMGLRAPYVPQRGITVSADPRSDMSTPRLADMRWVTDMDLRAPYVPRRGIRVSADAPSLDRARHPADTGPSTPVCMSVSLPVLAKRGCPSGCTRPLVPYVPRRGIRVPGRWVHPRLAFSSTPASRPLLRLACIRHTNVSRNSATSPLSQRPSAPACDPTNLCTQCVHRAAPSTGPEHPGTQSVHPRPHAKPASIEAPRAHDQCPRTAAASTGPPTQPTAGRSPIPRTPHTTHATTAPKENR
jgi:hypothetical protein